MESIVIAVVEYGSLQGERLYESSNDLILQWFIAMSQKDATAELIKALNIALPLKSFSCMVCCYRGQPAGDQGGRDERKKCYPVLGISDGQGSYRREEEVVETKGGQNG
jgi:hypothetical protein